ncbi:hypothetical protein C1646_775623 [Rhizophagus diaphanus]|nr:hypothetical protein C1646_775623 [Rhizophagus diaphanus] [Rhizophagus sp. MUCL 43196]
MFKEKISSDYHPLIQVMSFVIAIFDNIFCVAQIIAIYEQNASMHSYIDMPILELKSFSYVSIKIFFHINGAIFSEIHDHSFCIFSHVEPLHIIHHLASKDISINEKALILKGQAKKTFNTLNKKNIFSNLQVLGFVLDPLRKAVLSLESRRATLADCFLSLAKFAATLKKLSKSLNPAF